MQVPKPGNARPIIDQEGETCLAATAGAIDEPPVGLQITHTGSKIGAVLVAMRQDRVRLVIEPTGDDLLTVQNAWMLMLMVSPRQRIYQRCTPEPCIGLVHAG